jgi:ATP-dependent DNA helicase RecQ
VLRGEMPVRLRETVATPREKRGRRQEKPATPAPAIANLDTIAQARYAALKAWRTEVARAHNLPAYIIFHDATLAAIAQLAPQSLADLQEISGIGEKKLQAYGDEVLQICALAAA